MAHGNTGDMTNPFDLLGIPACFDVDEGDLHQRFITGVAACHPDRYTDPLDQADAAQRAAELNAAYQSLKDPESRANVLLKLLGGSLKEDDKSLPPQLLMEVMEAREQLEEAMQAGDQAMIDRLHHWGHDQRRGHLEQIGQLFQDAQATAQEDRPAILKKIRLELNALRYFQRMTQSTQDAHDL